MNSMFITLAVLLAVVAITFADRSTDCVCLSASFGCEKIKNPIKMVQTGFCNKRCCTDGDPNEKRHCSCMNKRDCPEGMREDGDCVNLVECCPENTKSEL